MISKLVTIGPGMVVALGAAAFGIFAVAGTSASTTASPAATSAASAATAPSLLAVAIGELQETGGAPTRR